MSSVAPLSAPTVAGGAGLVNATALDGQLRLIVAKVNEVVRAVGRLRRASDNTLGDESVRLRNLADTAMEALQDVVDNLAAIGAQIRTAIMDPLGGAITTARFPSGPQRVGEPISLTPSSIVPTLYPVGGSPSQPGYDLRVTPEWIFSGDPGANSGNGVVAAFNRATLTYTYINTPSGSTLAPGFGSGLCVVAGKLFVGAYGWSIAGHQSVGRVFIYDAVTLAYLGFYPGVDDESRFGGDIASNDGNIVFIGGNCQYGSGGGFVYVYVGGVYSHKFNATSPSLFGDGVFLSPNGNWLLATNNGFSAGGAEVVIFSMVGSVATFHSRIVSPNGIWFFGGATSWDPDSLGFWVAQGGGLAFHYRWNGSAFASIASIAALAGQTALWVTQDRNGTDVFVVRSDRLSRLTAALTETTYWTAAASPYHRPLVQLSVTDLVVGVDTGIGIAGYVPVKPLNGEYLYGGLVGTPLTRAVPITVPGVVGLSYRIKFRLRTMMEGAWVTDPTFAGYVADANGPTAASTFYPDAAPSDVLVDGRTYVSAARSIKPGPSYYDNLRMVVVRADRTDTYILNGLPAFGTSLDGKYFGITTLAGREPISPCWPIDTTLEFIVRAGDVITFTHTNSDGSSALAGKTNFPDDDDLRFPYLGRYRDAVALQLDLTDLEPISELAYPGLLQAQLGGILETEGPGGFLEA